VSQASGEELAAALDAATGKRTLNVIFIVEVSMPPMLLS
jgi:hypothetical protein